MCFNILSPKNSNNKIVPYVKDILARKHFAVKSASKLFVCGVLAGKAICLSILYIHTILYILSYPILYYHIHSLSILCIHTILYILSYTILYHTIPSPSHTYHPIYPMYLIRFCDTHYLSYTYCAILSYPMYLIRFCEKERKKERSRLIIVYSYIDR